MIPQEWDVKSFDDLFDFRNGVNAEKQAYGQGVPFINVLEPITYSHIYGPEISGRIMLSESLLNSYAVRHGDVLFNRTSETQEEVGLASAYLGSEQVVFGGFVICGRPKNDSLDPLYSGYALRAPSVRSQIIPMGQGAIRANISQQNLKLVLALVPAPTEQSAIATALRDVDELLKGLERLTAKKRDLKQAAMQQLLTGKTRLQGFSGKWKQKPLDALSSMKSGDTITSTHIDHFSNYPCYGGNGLRGYTSSFTHDGMYVLIGRQGALCGNVFGVDGQFFASEHAIVVTPFAETDVRWLAYALTRMNLNQYSESSAQPGLSVSKILKLEVFAPPTKDEQAAIATVLTDMDAELSTLEQRLAKTRNLKQAMMQDLLTGRTRLL